MPTILALLLLSACRSTPADSGPALGPCGVDPRFIHKFNGFVEDLGMLNTLVNETCPASTRDTLQDLVYDLKPYLAPHGEDSRGHAAIAARRARARAIVAKHCPDQASCELPWAVDFVPSRTARAAGKLLYDAMVQDAGPATAEVMARTLLNADIPFTVNAGLSSHFVGHKVPSSTLFGINVSRRLRIKHINGHDVFSADVPRLIEAPAAYQQPETHYLLVGLDTTTPLSALLQPGLHPNQTAVLLASQPRPEGVDFATTDHDTVISAHHVQCPYVDSRLTARLQGTEAGLTYNTEPFGPNAATAYAASACENQVYGADVIIRASPDLPIVTALRHLEAVDHLTFTDRACPDGKIVQFQPPCIEIIAAD